jgi:hypothetical protein
MKRTLQRGSLLVAAAALATSGLSIISIAPAGAASYQTCKTLKGTATLTPGLSTVPKTQTVTAKANATGCAPASKTGGSGVLTSKASIPNGSCQGLATGGQTIKLASTMKWKNGKSSKLALTAKTGSGSTATVATITGKVTSGLFVGKKVKTTITFTVKSGENCTTVPVKHLTIKNTKPLVFFL